MNVRERIIAAALVAAMLGAILFVLAYATSGDRLYEGLSMTLAAAGLCAASIGWAFWILPPETVVDERDDYPSTAPDRAAESSEIRTTQEAVTRRKSLARLLYAALGLFAVALVVPLRSLGTSPYGEGIFASKWRKGSRLVREDGSFVRASDLNVDCSATVFPEGALGDANSQTVLVRCEENIAPAARGFIAYSKVCTHAGCPVALYRASEKQLMCPCHQSVFDVVNDGRVVAGPADHALPRLPVRVDADGFLRADGNFNGPVGPSYWQRGAG